MLDNLYLRNADRAVYVDADGASLSVLTLVDHNLAQYGDVAEIKAGSVIVAMRVSEVKDRPRREDTIALADGDTYYIDSVLSSDGYEHRCIAHTR